MEIKFFRKSSQHADHFTRVLNEKESFRREKFLENSPENNNSEDGVLDANDNLNKSDLINETEENNTNKNNQKKQVEAN